MMRLAASYTLDWQDNSPAPAQPGAVRKWHWGFDGSRGNWAILLGCGRRLRELDRDRLAAEVIAGHVSMPKKKVRQLLEGVAWARVCKRCSVLFSRPRGRAHKSNDANKEETIGPRPWSAD